MIKKTFILLLFIFCLNSFSQTKKLYLIKENNLYGYIDNAGKKVITPKFEKAFPFYDGLAAVKINGLFGYIDMKGKIVIKPKYKHAYNFHNGIAKTIIEKDTIYITKEDKKLDFANPNYIVKFNNDNFIFETKSRKYGVFNISENKIIVDTTKNWISSLSKNSYALTYELVKPIKNSIDSVFNEKIVFYDLKTKEKLQTEDLYNTYKIERPCLNFNGECIIVDSDGKTIINLTKQFPKEKFVPFNDSFFDNNYITDDYICLEKIGILNKKGNFLYKNEEKHKVSNPEFNKFYVEKPNGKFDILSTKTNIKILDNETLFGNIITRFYEYFTVVSTKSEIKIYNNDFELLNSSNYETVIPASNNYFFFKKSRNGKYGISNYNNEVLVDEIIDLIYFEKYPLYNTFYYHENLRDLVKVKINNLEAYINEFGKIIWTETNNTHTTILPEHKNISFATEREIEIFTKDVTKKISQKDEVYFELTENENTFQIKIYNLGKTDFDLRKNDIEFSFDAKNPIYYLEYGTSFSDPFEFQNEKNHIIKPNHYYELQLKKFFGNNTTEVSVRFKYSDNDSKYQTSTTFNSNSISFSIDCDILNKKDYIEDNNFFDPYFYD